LPNNYPLEKPTIIFHTPIFHPYIHFSHKSGNLSGPGTVCMEFNSGRETEWDPFEQDNIAKGFSKFMNIIFILKKFANS